MKVLEISKLDTKRKPIITIDDNLDKYSDIVPCQEKVDKANHMLKTNNFFEKNEFERKNHEAITEALTPVLATAKNRRKAQPLCLMLKKELNEKNNYNYIHTNK